MRDPGEPAPPSRQRCLSLTFPPDLASRVHKLTPSGVPLSTAYEVHVGQTIVQGVARSMERHYSQITQAPGCDASISVALDRLGFNMGLSIFSPQIALVQLTVTAWRPGMQQPAVIVVRGRGLVEPSSSEAWASVAQSVGVPPILRNGSESFFEKNIAIAWARALARAIADFEQQAQPLLGITPTPLAPWLAQGGPSTPWNPAWDQDWDAHGTTVAAGAAAGGPAQGVHLHDGFFLRMELGWGVGVTRAEDRSEWTFRHGGLIQAGTALRPGLILTAEVGADQQPQPSGVAVKATSLLAGLVYYPRADRGLHLGAAVGYGIGTLSAESPADPDERIDVADLQGPSFRASIGHEWWVSDNWSLGGALSFRGSRLSGDGYSAWLLLPTLAFVATYN